MLEFAREQWLWTLILVAACFVAWWFARRYRKQRVTYGAIWERVAKRVLPPAWKRVLRTILTLTVAGLMLTAIVFRAAGLQRPADEQPSPKLVVIVLDNSPSMRAVHDGKSRAQMAHERAQEIVDALGESDRAIAAHYKEGTLLLGRWLKRGDVLGHAPPTDFARSDPAALPALVAAIRALTPPPDLPAEPPPEKIAFLLTDHPTGDLPPMFEGVEGLKELLGVPTRLDDLLGVPTHVETFGAAVVNHALARVHYEPPAPEDGTGGKLTATAFEYGEAWRANHARVTANGVELALAGNEYALPASSDPQEVRVFTGETDALPHDDEVRMQLNPQALQRVAVCSPAGEDTNTLLHETLADMLPGRDFFACGPDATVETDLLVCDRALPATFKARYLLCFGVLPGDYGKVAEPVRADAGLQLRTEPPRGLGFELPDLSLLEAREARPLADGHLLQPLVRHINGSTLIAVQRGEPELLYCGFVPHLSTLLSRDYSGFLLLLRWLTTIQGDASPLIPPFVDCSKETEFRLEGAAILSVKLADSPWLPCYGPREYTLTTAADGRGTLGPVTIPGEYTVTHDGREIGRFTAIWTNAVWQSLPYTALPATDLDALFHPAHEPDWRDHLPGLLLWLALGLMLIEWLLWLVGITE